MAIQGVRSVLANYSLGTSWRLLAAWHGDHVWSTTTIITAMKSPREIDRFHTVGTAVIESGWKALDVPSRKNRANKAPVSEDDTSEPEDQDLPAGLHQGGSQALIEILPVKKQTRPPKPHNDATLLSGMETAGRSLEDKELSRAMKDCGLGTPATRAAIIETLIAREYIIREGKTLRATDKGIRLIDSVHPDVASPAMTGQWESRLHAIQRGQGELPAFLKGIEDYVREVIGRVSSTPIRRSESVPQQAYENAVALYRSYYTTYSNTPDFADTKKMFAVR